MTATLTTIAAVAAPVVALIGVSVVWRQGGTKDRDRKSRPSDFEIRIADFDEIDIENFDDIKLKDLEVRIKDLADINIEGLNDIKIDDVEVRINDLKKRLEKQIVVRGRTRRQGGGGSRRRTMPTATVPAWALGLLGADARRYAWEWGAHLQQLVDEGQIKQVRIDRRRMVGAAMVLAIMLRVRRAVSRART